LPTGKLMAASVVVVTVVGYCRSCGSRKHNNYNNDNNTSTFTQLMFASLQYSNTLRLSVSLNTPFSAAITKHECLTVRVMRKSTTRKAFD